MSKTRRDSADQTRALLRKREEEIDRRVADLKSRLNTEQPAQQQHGGLRRLPSGSSFGMQSPDPTPKMTRNVSQSSDDSVYHVNRGMIKPKALSQSRFGNPAFSDAERHSTTAGSDAGTPGRGSPPPLRSHSHPRAQASGSQYPTARRVSSIKKPSFVPTPKPKKQTKSWMQWFCPCNPGRKNAAQSAASANNRYERQKLLEEEGRLAYGSNADVVNTPTNSYHYGSASPSPYHYSASPRSSRARSNRNHNLIPASQRNSVGSTRY